MEYPMMIAGEHGEFIVHLTQLEDFHPVREGYLELVFLDSHGHVTRITETELLREGIFAPTVELGHIGSYGFKLNYFCGANSATFEIDDFEVFRSEHDLPQEDEHEKGYISFLKEQQWKIPFATVLAEVREIRSSVAGVATVNAHPNASLEIVAPVDGIISSSSLFNPGQEVRAGESVLSLLPQLNSEGGWTDLQSLWEQVSSEWERAQRLHDQSAISDREFEQIRLRFETMQSGMATVNASSSGSHFTLKSPISASVAEVFVLPGEAVEAGQPLMRLIQRNKYRITAEVFQMPSGGVDSISGMALYLPNSHMKPLTFDDLTPVASPVMVNPANQSIPVQFDVSDLSNPLQIGQRLRVDLYGQAEDNSLSVPESSIFLDEGMDVVFVQVSGESFDKRIVVKGARDNGWIAITEDIHPGEHVVSTGGYHVKLASMSGEIGHGHAH